MIIRPKIRGFVCTTAHPEGCKAHVQQQIDYVKKQPKIVNGPKKVLIIGASTGYGLASRITAAFGSNADTLGLFFEKEPSAEHTASAGWYNNVAIEKMAKAQGLYAKSINGDAFSDEMKAKTIEILQKEMGPVDLVVYSLASPRRTHPKTGQVHKSVLKPIGKPFSDKTLDTDKGEVKTISIEAANEQEIQDTITVMGGEDWEMWIQALSEKGLLAKGCKTIAYTYLGAKPTWAIYGHGTIGMAKKDLERATKAIQQRLDPLNAKAYLGVMKAIVTQASSAIPLMPLYISLLYKIMKDKKIHEDAIQQVYRLFSTALYSENSGDASGKIEEGYRIRMDDLELQPEIQNAIEKSWKEVTTENLNQLTDFKGYQSDFLKLFGFGLANVNYEVAVDPIC